MVGRLVVRVVAGLAAVAVVLLWPVVAQADLLLVFKQGRSAVGERVEAFSGDRRGPRTLLPVHGIRLYFVPMGRAKSPARQTSTGPPSDPTWLSLGRMHHPHTGVFKTSFIVPDVAPGSYTIGFWCIPCAPPRGATFTGAYPGHLATGRPFTTILRVTAAPEKAVDSSRHPDVTPVNVIVATVGLAVGLSELTGIRLYKTLGRGVSSIRWHRRCFHSVVLGLRNHRHARCHRRGGGRVIAVGLHRDGRWHVVWSQAPQIQ